MLVIFEKMRVTKLISRSLALLLLFWIRVGYSRPTSSPLCTHLFDIFIAYLHALAEKTRTFPKSLNDKMGLSSNSFNAKVKPSWLTVRVCFLLEINHKSIIGDHFDSRNITTFKITLENNRTQGNDFADLRLNFVNIFACFFYIRIPKNVNLFVQQLQFLTLVVFRKILFSMFLKWRGGDLLGKDIRQHLLFDLFELAQAIILIRGRLHLFLLLEQSY